MKTRRILGRQQPDPALVGPLCRQLGAGRWVHARRQAGDRVPELVEMMDDAIGPELVDRHFGIAEGNRDDGNARGSCGSDVGERVADHYRCRRIAAGPRDGRGQVAGVWLEHVERIPPADGGKAISHTKQLQKLDGLRLELVRADREHPAGVAEPLEGSLDAGEQPAHVGDMVAVMGDEIREKPLEFLRARGAAAGRKAAFEQRARPGANEIARLFEGQGRQVLAGEDDIERPDQVGCGVGQRAIEVESQNAGRELVHAAQLAENRSLLQGRMCRDKEERGRPRDGLAAGLRPMVMGMVERRMIQWGEAIRLRCR
ncbi:hypothetical protein CHELA1G2_11361 [Hyphomicrobiales bacterium]|nr:hypothetical protein CHELA1G2_11361 [Hyphomicrobiales bacterium]